MPRPQLRAGPLRFALDVLLVLWIAWWVWAGATVWTQLQGLGNLAGAAGRLGRSVSELGATVDQLPLVGGDIGAGIRDAGAQAQASARSARAGARRLGWMLGISIAVIPTVPLALFYLPARQALGRERRALLDALASGEASAFDEVLARRAVVHLPYRTLRRVTADPAGDLRTANVRLLADAELARFGLYRRRPVRDRTGE